MVTEASNVRILLKYELMPEDAGTSLENKCNKEFELTKYCLSSSCVYESVDVNIKLVTCRGDYPPII